MPAMVQRGRGRRTINEINMVPFIDVMLVLLIIFMVTAPLIAPSVINLPSVGKASQPPQQVVQVQVRKDEGIDIKVDEKTQSVPLADLGATVRQLQGQYSGGESAVVIAADKAVRYEIVVKVMDALKRAGVERVGLSVQVQK
ncbi:MULTISPECIES: biopolymer transporter ExbD [Ramlibacter]|uniref:Biopolymer transporter ExbD n=1 Tax=Ramlibacter aquaticus TaxID=2780094 RepID=A0ABR9SI04_9BURK|nr:MULTISPECIES: biopolymer transporter ExbD [Ramlibacter]MBE7941982.1 biopolymer transporter ExbD [Ramlibacter aquaticus]